MATIKTNDSRTLNARNMIESFVDCEGNPNAYMFIGGTNPWENENEPPLPTNNLKEYYEVHNEMLSLTRINTLDVHYMIPKVKWISGTVFDMYRHDYTPENRSHSGATNLYDAVYFVLSQNNHVYVCLNNNGDKPSLVEPQNVSDDPFVTSDGYQWIRLFKVSQEVQDVYSTLNLLPISGDEVNPREPGEVHTVLVENPGTRYTNNPEGPIGDVPDYYCHIVGDGYGAVAKVRVRSGGIESVEVVRPGKGYTYAKLDFTANRVYKGIAQLDSLRNAVDPLGDGKFSSTVIISPPSGWGYQEDRDLSVEENKTESIHRLALQLSSRTVGVFSSFKSENLDAYTDSVFRQVGILHDVKFALDSENAPSLSAVNSIKFSSVTHDGFEIGEMIEQNTFDEDSNFVKAVGKVVSYDKENMIVRYITTEYTVNDEGRSLYLSGNESVKGRTTEAVGQVDRQFSEALGGVKFRRGYAAPELKKYVGYLSYLTNQRPIQRVPTQTERVSLTISF